MTPREQQLITELLARLNAKPSTAPPRGARTAQIALSKFDGSGITMCSAITVG
jgi:hypothetical protein